MTNTSTAELQKDIAGRNRLIRASKRLIAWWRSKLPRPHPKPQLIRLTMYDAVDVDAIPPLAQAVAGYVDGRYANLRLLRAKFPHAKILSIAVTRNGDAECLDVERGDATVSDVGPWIHRMRALGVKRPCIYASLSNMEAVLRAIRQAGIQIEDVRLWVADWTGEPHIPAGYDGCQWVSEPHGTKYDQSLVLGSFFGESHPG